jgi:hypothetical protein
MMKIKASGGVFLLITNCLFNGSEKSLQFLEGDPLEEL